MNKSDFRLLLKSKRTNQPFVYCKAGLWYSDEYLIEEKTNSYTNNCKKFELSKIQALLYYKTSSNMIKTMICGFIALANLLLLLFGGLQTGFLIFWGIILLFLVFYLIIKVNQGDSCRAFLVTAVGEHELESIGTIKRAKLMVERIKVLVGSVQGDVDQADIALRINEFSSNVTRKPMGTIKK